MGSEQEITQDFVGDEVDPRDKAFLKAYFETGCVKKAAIESGLCTKKRKDGTPDAIRASIMGSQALKRLRPEVSTVLNVVGGGLIEISSRVVQLLHAKKHFQTKDGQIHSFDDDQTSLKAAELLYKVHGAIQNGSPVMKLQAPEGPIVHQHRHSLEGKSDEELHRIFAEENRTRKAVRAIGSGA